MERDPIKISWDDLKSQQVEERLREQSTVKSTKDHYEKANVVAPTFAPPSRLRKVLLSAMFYLAIFGFIGALAGWLIGEALNYRPDRSEEARQLIYDYESLGRKQAVGRIGAADADRARARIRDIGADNPYFMNHIEPDADAALTSRRETQALQADARDEFKANILLFAVSGMLIAMALASADRIIERDYRGATIDAAVGAMVGFAGGLAVAFVIDLVEARILGDDPLHATLLQRMLSRAVCWTLLGAFIGAAPGAALRSLRRANLGILGGMAGGIIGGLLFDPLTSALGSAAASRLIGLLAIGLFAGLAMGWLENVAKQGWLRVAEGIIAGKQFILYRNPTFVGSAPMSHIYLFRDNQVGRRHAAIYHENNVYEIENLPLGGPTLVNEKPITRVRLRGGDRVKIGRSVFLFEEKHAS
jgi:hypothetical protein